MAQRVSAREARARFAELTDRVRYTGESVIIEKQGTPFVALVSLEDLARLERLRRDLPAAEFSRHAAHAAQETGPGPTEEQILSAVKQTREELYRKRYGAA